MCNLHSLSGYLYCQDLCIIVYRALGHRCKILVYKNHFGLIALSAPLSFLDFDFFLSHRTLRCPRFFFVELSLLFYRSFYCSSCDGCSFFCVLIDSTSKHDDLSHPSIIPALRSPNSLYQDNGQFTHFHRTFESGKQISSLQLAPIKLLQSDLRCQASCSTIFCSERETHSNPRTYSLLVSGEANRTTIPPCRQCLGRTTATAICA